MSADLDAIASEFRAVDRAPSSALARAVDRGTERIRRGYLILGLILALLTAASVIVVWRERDLASVLFAIGQIGVGVASLVYHHVTTAHVMGASSHTTRAFLELEAARLKRRIGAFRFLVAELAFLVPLMATGQILRARDTFAGPAATMLGNVIGLVAPYVILVAILLRVAARRRRQRGELARVEGLLASIDDP